MRAQLYTAFPGVFTVACYSIRPTDAPSAKFTAAAAHEEFVGLASSLLEEHKHITPLTTLFPAAQCLWNYFPADPAGNALFIPKHLAPAGIVTDIDAENFLEITRLRYEFRLENGPGWGAGDPVIRNNRMRAMTYALKQLFTNNGIPLAFIHGDGGIRPANGDSAVTQTEVDFIVDFAPALNRTGVDIPDPA